MSITISNELLRRKEEVITGSIVPIHPVFVKQAQGHEIIDIDGNVYVDLTTGIGINNLGHAHPAVVEAIHDQCDQFAHVCFQVCMYESYVEVAEELHVRTPGDFLKKTFFVTSGAEAIEGAVKFARAYTGRRAVLALNYGFHGRTMYALQLSGRVAPYRIGFGLGGDDVYHFPFPHPYRAAEMGLSEVDPVESCLKALEQLFMTQRSPDDFAAVVFEPILGEGGIVVPPRDFFQKLERICRNHGILLIADEVQTGISRTGPFCASTHFQIEPDLIAFAKALGFGIPLGAITGRAPIMDSLGPGGVGGTTGGNPVACRAALAGMRVLDKEKIPDHVAEVSELVFNRLEHCKANCPLVGDIRGEGLMIGLELVKDQSTKEPAVEETASVVNTCRERGILVLRGGPYRNLVRILPPLNIDSKTMIDSLEVVIQSIKDVDENR